MKLIIVLLLVAQVLGVPPTSIAPKGRGIVDTLLAAPSRLCLCRCGLPNREVRSVKISTDVKIESEKIEVPRVHAEENDKKKPEGKAKGGLKGQTKLIGGDVPSTLLYPWLVLVMHKGKVVAGGAIISDSHIITAASPFASAVSFDIKVRLSVQDRCAGEVTSSNISVEALVMHPAYSPASRAHDIALLRLANPLRFHTRLHPICMPNSRNTYSGEVATIVSWLSPTAGGGEPNCEPHRINQPILPDSDCSKTVTSTSLLTTDKACLGVIGSNSLICGGDVGAPVMVLNSSSGKYELVGILTDVNVCNQSNATLFIKVTDHLNWITDTTTNDCMCRVSI